MLFVLITSAKVVQKTNSIMKEIKIVEKGENFTTVNVGKLNEIRESPPKNLHKFLSAKRNVV